MTHAANPALRAAALLLPAPQPALSRHDREWIRIVRWSSMLAALALAMLLTNQILILVWQAHFAQLAASGVITAPIRWILNATTVLQLGGAAILAVALWWFAARRPLSLDRSPGPTARRTLRFAAALWAASLLLSAVASYADRWIAAAGHQQIGITIYALLNTTRLATILPLALAAALHTRSVALALAGRRTDRAIAIIAWSALLLYGVELVALAQFFKAVGLASDNVAFVTATSRLASVWIIAAGLIVAMLMACAAHKRLRDEPPAEPDGGACAPSLDACLACGYSLPQRAQRCPECGVATASMCAGEVATLAAMPPRGFFMLGFAIVTGAILIRVIVAVIGATGAPLRATRPTIDAASLLTAILLLAGCVGWRLVLARTREAEEPLRIRRIRRIGQWGLILIALHLAIDTLLRIARVDDAQAGPAVIAPLYIVGVACWWIGAASRIALIGDRGNHPRLVAAAVVAMWWVPSCLAIVIPGRVLAAGDAPDILARLVELVRRMLIAPNFFFHAQYALPLVTAAVLYAHMLVRLALALRRAR